MTNLLFQVQNTARRFLDGHAYMDVQLGPYGRREFNWATSASHWSHFALLCMRRDVIYFLREPRHAPDFHVTWQPNKCMYLGGKSLDQPLSNQPTLVLQVVSLVSAIC